MILKLSLSYKMILTQLLALVSLLLLAFYVPAAVAQNYTTNFTQVLPESVYSVFDKNGDDISTDTLNIYGPSLSIGDPQQGGLIYKPVIGGWSINSHYPLQNGQCYGCFMNGFQGSSSLTALLTFGGPTWESMTGYQAQVSFNGGIARFQSKNDAFKGFIEYSPSVGRTLTYSDSPLTNNMTYDGSSYYSMKFSEVFTDKDGTQYIFTQPIDAVNYPYCKISGSPDCSYSLPVSRIIRPGGETIDFYYQIRASPSNTG